MTVRLCLLLLLTFAFVAPVLAQDPTEAEHNQLRALRDDMVDAVNKNDIDRLLTHLAPNVVVTFEDAEVARGPEGVRAYYQKMMKGPGAIVASFQTSVAVDDLTVLYGDDTGVAFGSADDKFTLSSGTQLALKSRWTATLVKQDGKWAVAAFHASAGMFDNPILDKMKTTAYIAGVFGLVMGLTLGAGGVFLLSRRGKKES